MAKERPILFSTAMVQAILDDRKTQTRREYKKVPEGLDLKAILAHSRDYVLAKCPYGKPGDLLWVRETWCLTQPTHPEAYHFGYKAEGAAPHSDWEASEKYDFSEPDKWHPSIHMPKEAARIWLRVTDIRVERLQDITEDDAIAEGSKFGMSVEKLSKLVDGASEQTKKSSLGNMQGHQLGFMQIWAEINGLDSWQQNPWVWVVSFQVLSKTGKPVLSTEHLTLKI